VTIQVDEEALASVLGNLAQTDQEWARTVSGLVTADQAAAGLKLLALDTRRAGRSFPGVSVAQSTLQPGVTIEDLCVQVPVLFKLFGLELLEADCLMTISGEDGARFIYRAEADGLFLKTYLYTLAMGATQWSVSVTMDESAAGMQDIAETIGSSFVLR
jgi:hypothetical protein